MPAKYLLCQKTSGKVTIEDCKKCDDRCLSLPTLTDIATYRDWRGFVTTTQALNGTRQSYYEIICDYTVDPYDRAFTLLGTRHHAKLESVAKKIQLIAEEYLKGEISSGIIDLLEPTNQDGIFDLWDYKTSGSFVINRALGLEAVKEKNMPITYKVNPAKIDMESWELQLNNYRLMLEDKNIGFKIRYMYIQATVRDGNTLTAFNRGLDKNIYKIPVKRLEDDYVKNYFKTKSDALLNALDTKTVPPPCSYKENWNYRKCQKYCPVAEFCDVGIYQRSKYKPLQSNSRIVV
jgi:hypothetical protein